MKTAIAKWLPWLTLVIIVSIGLNVWLFWGNRDHTRTDSAHSSAADIYTCPMDPEVQQNQPGKCPICGMNLILKKVDSTQSKSNKSESPEKESSSVGSDKYQLPLRTA